jgi:hypothetical protein
MGKTKTTGGSTAKNRVNNSHNKSSKNNNHNFSPTKSKSKSKAKAKPYKRLTRNKKGYSNQDVEEEVIVQRGGAAVDDEYSALIGFCLGNSEVQVTKKIINKKIYVKTQIDLDKFVELKRSGLLIGLYSNLSSFTKGWKDYFMSKTPEQIQAEKTATSAKMLEDLKRKNQYLPLIFKEISAIGFLAEYNQALTSVKDDDDLLSRDKPVKVEWIKISTSATILNIFDMSKKFIEDNLVWSLSQGAKVGTYGALGTAGVAGVMGILDYILATSILTGALTKISTTFSSAGALSTEATAAALSTEAAAAGGYTYLLSAFSRFIGGAAIIYGVWDLWDLINQSDVDQSRILNSFALKTIFSIITDVRYITVSSLENTNASTLFVESLKLDFFKSFRDMKTYTETFGVALSSLTERKTVQKENPQQYPITTYDSKTIEPPDIKAKLTNLNIPFTAFSYALTVVQSTYVKETGDMLTQYYNNKDKFMEEYKKKLKR